MDILAGVYYKKQNYEKLEKILKTMIIKEYPLTDTIVGYIIECGDYFKNPFLKSYYNSLKTKIDLMELHFNYSEKGLGFQEAKTDFIKQITS